MRKKRKVFFKSEAPAKDKRGDIVRIGGVEYAVIEPGLYRSPLGWVITSADLFLRSAAIKRAGEYMAPRWARRGKLSGEEERPKPSERVELTKGEAMERISTTRAYIDWGIGRGLLPCHKKEGSKHFYLWSDDVDKFAEALERKKNGGEPSIK